MATVNSTASKPKLQEFAKENFGVMLPEELTQKEMYAEVQRLMKESGYQAPKPVTKPADDGSGDLVVVTQNDVDDEPDEEQAPAAAAQPGKEKEPTHFTIEIQKPADTQFDEFVCCVNGRNYQVKYNEQVKVPAAVVEVLRMAVIDVPAYKNPNGVVEPARRKPRFVWAIHQKHYN